MKFVYTVLILMAFAIAACILQNWWDKMTAEDRMSGALKTILIAIIIIAVAVIAAVMI